MLMTCGSLLPFLCVVLLRINRMMEKHLTDKLRLEVFSLQSLLQVSVRAGLHFPH